MTTRIRFVFTLVFMMLAQWALTQNQFGEANRDYDQGQIEQAIENYEKIWASGEHSLELMHNLGTAYLKKGDIGHAILFLERRLSYGEDPQTRHNWSEAQKRIVDPIPEFDIFFLLKWWHALLGSLGSQGWSFLAISLLLVGSILLTIWVRRSDLENNKHRRLALITFMLAIFSFGLAHFAQERERSQIFAIVLDEGVPYYEAADERSDVVRKLSAGVKIQIIDSLGGWYKIQTPDKDRGWMTPSDLGLLEDQGD